MSSAARCRFRRARDTQAQVCPAASWCLEVSPSGRAIQAIALRSPIPDGRLRVGDRHDLQSPAGQPEPGGGGEDDSRQPFAGLSASGPKRSRPPECIIQTSSPSTKSASRRPSILFDGLRGGRPEPPGGCEGRSHFRRSARPLRADSVAEAVHYAHRRVSCIGI